MLLCSGNYSSFLGGNSKGLFNAEENKDFI